MYERPTSEPNFDEWRAAQPQTPTPRTEVALGRFVTTGVGLGTETYGQQATPPTETDDWLRYVDPRTMLD